MTRFEEIVREQIERERADLTERIATADARTAELQVEADRAWDAAIKDDDLDSPANRELDRKQTALNRAINMAAALSVQLHKLDDVNEVERRIVIYTQRRRSGKDDGTTEGDDMAAGKKKNGTTKKAATPRTPKADVPANIRKLVVDKVDGGMGVTSVAKLLDERQAKSQDTGREQWYGKAVWNIYFAETGKAPGASRKLASKAVAKNPPAPTAKLAPAAKKAATPITKKSQASGTSRGGSGTKKPAATTKAAKARTTAKKSGTARKPAARKVARRK